MLLTSGRAVTQMVAGQRNLAADLVSDVAHSTSNETVDLMSVMRKLLRASEFLEWKDSASWFRAEIEEFSYQNAPRHRYTNAIVEYKDPMMEMYSTLPNFPRRSSQSTIVQKPLILPLSELIRYRERGFSWQTGATRTVERRGVTGDRQVIETEWISFNVGAVETILDHIEQYCFDFAIATERRLRFTDLATDVFAEYRTLVEVHLNRLGIDENLKAIETNVRLGTAESSKLAILGCRNILLALSDRLWQVPGVQVHPALQTYDGKPLQLDEGQVKARLRAYLHERGLVLATKRGPTLIAGQLERNADAAAELYNLTSEQGKNEALVEDAKAAVLHTYFLVGEMARLTGFVPVTAIAGSADSNNSI